MSTGRPSGWMKDKDRSIALRTELQGGVLENDPNTANRKIREARDGGFCENRLRADRYHDERELENTLKEVWE